MSRHLVFIVNPHSGVDRKKAIGDVVAAELDRSVFSYEIQYTQYAGHGTALAAAAATAGAYAVVAVGGDGSVGDVLKGLLGSTAILAIIPKGSGNGMARTLGIPLDISGALAVINRNHVMAMDIGFAGDRVFMSNAGVGFDALIAAAFAASRRRGMAVYSWLVTRHLWTYRAPEWELTIDGRTVREKAFMITVANGRQFGYNFTIAPDASWTDGLLDIIVIRQFPKLLGGALAWRAMRGRITDSRFVKQYRGKEIIIARSGLRQLQTDGDAHPCSSPVRFSVQPGAQRILVP